MSWNEYRNERRDIDKATAWGASRIFLWVVIAIVVSAGIGAAIWGITVATSGIKGEGDGVIQKNSAENWLDAQARFEENYAEYESTIFKIKQAQKALQDDPDNAILQTNYQGTVNYCASLVADYNADARNYLREDFKAADLPDQIDVRTCEPIAVP